MFRYPEEPRVFLFRYCFHTETVIRPAYCLMGTQVEGVKGAELEADHTPQSSA
jgi:hypothetical protein